METLNIKNYRQRLEQDKGEKNYLNKMLNETVEKHCKLKRELVNTRFAKKILQIVAQDTQKNLENRISHIVSLALFAIFNEPYEFKINFILKRGKTECDMFFFRNDWKINPLTESGGGAVDVASFALRVALWNMKKPRDRNIMILDEPFKFLSSKLQPRAAKLLKILSDKLKLQFIIVTNKDNYNDDFLDVSDKIFEVTKINQISLIKEIFKKNEDN